MADSKTEKEGEVVVQRKLEEKKIVADRRSIRKSLYLINPNRKVEDESLMSVILPSELPSRASQRKSSDGEESEKTGESGESPGPSHKLSLTTKGSIAKTGGNSGSSGKTSGSTSKGSGGSSGDKEVKLKIPLKEKSRPRRTLLFDQEKLENVMIFEEENVGRKGVEGRHPSITVDASRQLFLPSKSEIHQVELEELAPLAPSPRLVEWAATVVGPDGDSRGKRLKRHLTVSEYRSRRVQKRFLESSKRALKPTQHKFLIRGHLSSLTEPTEGAEAEVVYPRAYSEERVSSKSQRNSLQLNYPRLPSTTLEMTQLEPNPTAFEFIKSQVLFTGFEPYLEDAKAHHDIDVDDEDGERSPRMPGTMEDYQDDVRIMHMTETDVIDPLGENSDLTQSKSMLPSERQSEMRRGSQVEVDMEDFAEDEKEGESVDDPNLISVPDLKAKRMESLDGDMDGAESEMSITEKITILQDELRRPKPLAQKYIGEKRVAGYPQCSDRGMKRLSCLQPGEVAQQSIKTQDLWGIPEYVGLSKGELVDLLHLLQNYPTNEHIYLSYVHPPQHPDFNPYSLKVVKAKDLNLKQYFTISKNGVMMFSHGFAHYYSMVDFEKEMHMYERIKKIKFFVQFRMWKAFYIWRHNVRRSKNLNTTKVLDDSLFMTKKPLRRMVSELFRMCDKISTMGFLAMRPYYVYTIKDFITTQENRLKEIQVRLRAFESMVIEMTAAACRAVLIDAGFSPDEYQLELEYYLKSLEVPLDSVGKVSGVGDYPGQWLTYSHQAKKREICGRLASFIHLIDYYVQRTYHRLMKNSMLSLMCEMDARISFIEKEYFSPLKHLQKFSRLLAKNEQLGGPILVSTSESPIFEVGCNWQEEKLAYSPSFEEYKAAVRYIFSMWEEAILSYPNMLPNKIFDPYTQPIINGAMQVKKCGAGPSMQLLIDTDLDLPEIEETVDLIMLHGFECCDNYTQIFEEIRLFCVENEAVNVEDFRAVEDVQEFGRILEKFNEQLNIVNRIEDEHGMGIFRVNNGILRENALPTVQRCLQVLHEIVPQIGAEQVKRIEERMVAALRILEKSPTNADEYVDYLLFLDEIGEEMEDIEKELDVCSELYDLVEQYAIPADEEDMKAYNSLQPTLLQLRNILDAQTINREKLMEELLEHFKKDTEGIFRDMAEIRKAAMAPEVLDPASDSEAMLEKMGKLKERLKGHEERANKFNLYQKQLKLEVTDFEALEELIKDVKLRHQLWDSITSWAEAESGWNTAVFSGLEPEDINAEVNRFLKAISQLEKGLPENELVPALKEKVEAMKALMPLIVNLHNPNLKHRHWDELEKVMSRSLTEDSVTLESLKESGFENFADVIQEVSSQASSEYSLEALLKKVEDSWKDVDFVVLPHKDQRDVFILGGTDDIQVLLDDSSIHMTTIASSRHVGPIKHKVDEWVRLLELFARTLEEWLTCQKNWIYLESIFCAPDIQRQLPNEAKMFGQVDKAWRDIMSRTNKMPAALRAATQPGLLEILQTNNELLDQIMKCLDDYLESKRAIFPRFYFLSNEELLEILAQTRNPQAVQPHLRKCFDAIQKLEFGGPASAVALDVLAMMSPEEERVPLTKGLKARGNVEEWLCKVEDAMFNSLKRIMRNTLTDYHSFEREEWLTKFPSQCILTISQLMWAQHVHEILDGVGDRLGRMAEFEKKNFQDLTKLATMVRGQLPTLVRSVLCALITVDVHARDIITSLVGIQVTDSSNFEWLKQLRYYWDGENEIVITKMANARYVYGYEYLGASPRLVITPLTDRCYLCLMGALQLDLGGAPAGPAGTGKTETTKDLAKSLAFMCVVFNCSDGLDYKMMGRFFSGLAQSGGWCCFDEFNRIEIEVLSVIAQQLITIRMAKVQRLSRFMFEGREIKLVKTCAAFITMNPGYAGRTELPDNLKALFRPISMMVPDYTLIAEVILYSEGFESSKILANKMTQMYKLCSEQLSQQDHYDFGMRAVKSVLVMAGSMKRANADINENIVLIRALRDSNLPKFLAHDAVLLDGIIQDLFPGVVIPEQDYGILQEEGLKIAKERGLQGPECFIRKMIQLFDTMAVRHGVMLVGPTGGGKTTIYNVLKGALTSLSSKKQVDNPQFRNVDTYVLNPKAVSLGELYGEMNPLTLEWRDGLMGIMVRNAVKPKMTFHQWVICDGPVDAVWIENMNTVLDDNKMLCLANSERIKLSNWVRMLFEVQDLAQASPATVSRCGMVYVDPKEMGWLPYVHSWVRRSELVGHEDLKPLLLSLFERHVEAGLGFVAKNCREVIPQAVLGKVTMLCMILEGILGKGIDLNLEPGKFRQLILQIFVFAYVWALGGNLKEGDDGKFDSFTRQEFESEEFIKLPKTGSLFQYYVKVEGRRMELWETIKPAYVYSPSVSFVDVLVPTADTVRYGYLMELLLGVGRAVLLTGQTGTGKSAIAKYVLSSIAGRSNYILSFINFSAQTTSKRTQEMIEGKLEKRKKALMSAPYGKKVIVFIDDLNMPKLDRYGAQPALELLRQLMDFNGCYDRVKMHWKELQNVIMCGACAPPGGGRNVITPRLVRHFALLAIPPPSSDSLVQIYRSVLRGFLEEFGEEVRQMADKLVAGAIAVYQFMSINFLPTPSKSHYLFNMRDLSKCIQGLLQATKFVIIKKEQMSRLFYHESMRVFHDRLTDSTDRNVFTGVLRELCTKILGVGFGEQSLEGILFGDFIKPGVERAGREYEEILSKEKLKKILSDYLDEYNIMMGREVALVFFGDAAEHITRIARILRTDRGNALLVGVGGAGKQSLTRLAAYMSGYKCFQIELMRGYDYEAFHEDLKKLYEMSGMRNERVTFLFTDTQIAYEEFLEDINNILNSGEVPNLLEAEDQERMVSAIRADAKEAGIAEDNKDGLWDFFIRRIRSNLHIVLCMSPVGESFRVRCRMFPSLVNCCTINWFSEWPAEALLSVANLFLGKVGLGEKASAKELSLMCVFVHESVSKMADLYYEEMRRKFYTTPSSYLELINLFTKMLNDQREKIQMRKSRILNGLSKLLETNVLVKEMRVKLKELEPVLREKSEGVENLMIRLAEDQSSADIVRRNVQQEEAAAKEKAIETQGIAEDAQKDLSTALPALEAAVKALDALDNKDIAEIRGFQKPPKMVEMVMESVCVLFNRQADWATAKLILTDANFMKKLENYDKDNVSESVQKKLKGYVDNPNFQPEIIGKVSKACKSICIWVRAIDGYIRVFRTVEPKRNRYLAAKSELDQVMETLQVKQAQLNEVEKKIHALQELFDVSINEKQDLEDNMELTAARLKRAGRLTSALASEQTRWQESVKNFDQDMKNITGDVFVGAACIAYYGVFTSHYRQKLMRMWVEECIKLAIPVTPTFTLADLADPFEVRVWNAAGLPKDVSSTENAVLATRGRRWPLMIDPQDQANRWVKQMEGSKQLKVLKMSDATFMRTMENCIRVGGACLLEEVGETLDPSLEPVLLKHIFTQNGRQMIRLGDTNVDYDADFRLYMTSKLSNPHYLPEVCIKVTIINFTVTMEGLEDQLLSEVVGIERPDLESQRSTLVTSINTDKNQLVSLESKILKLLFQSEGNILDDEELVEALNDSKKTSVEISKRLKEAEDTEVRISGAREKYRSLAGRGSVLYFVVALLSGLDPMYQYSLKYFTQVFIQCIGSLEKTEGELEERMRILNKMATLATYTNISRGLFEKDKLVFSFLLCTDILKSEGKIPESEWNFFLRGGVGLEAKRNERPGGVGWLSTSLWNQLSDLESTFPVFEGIKMFALKESVKISIGNYDVILFENVDANALHLPAFSKGMAWVPWNKKLSKFQKLILIKACAEEKLVGAISEFVRSELGQQFVESPSIDLVSVAKDLNKTTPLVFILSVGSDPMAAFYKLANEFEFAERISSISLGQGQGPLAESMIHSASSSGDWVFLQNCHLAASWMPSLERIVKGLSEKDELISDSFRLFLSSMPSGSFPVSVLQDSVKITNEPPKGIRANVRQALLSLDKNLFEDNILGMDWRRIIFGICFFHAVIQERKKFGPLGWNIKYEFNDSDRECALLNLDMFCKEGIIPWDALEYITGQITYGGRITDNWDQRCLTHILKEYFCGEALKKDHVFSPSGVYYAPAYRTVKEYVNYVDSLPIFDGPEIFGMHENANITFQQQETFMFVLSLETVQPRQSAGKGASQKDEIAYELAANFEEKMPEGIDVEGIAPELSGVDNKGRAFPLSIFLHQEVERFNKMLRYIRESLGQVKKGIKGMVVMSEELEKMYEAFINNKVPENWSRISYSSMKPLGSWFKDMILRVNFISSWFYGRIPTSYWLSGFFFQQGFLTAVLQTYARKYSVPIDQLSFHYSVMPVIKLEMTEPDLVVEKSLMRTKKLNGVLVHGLFLEAGRWDTKENRLADPEPGVMNPIMPVIHFLPAHSVTSEEKVYNCPLYKTGVRAGVLSTTGHSTNFIVSIQLPTKQPEDYWILKGTALVSQLAD